MLTTSPGECRQRSRDRADRRRGGHHPVLLSRRARCGREVPGEEAESELYELRAVPREYTGVLDAGDDEYGSQAAD